MAAGPILIGLAVLWLHRACGHLDVAIGAIAVMGAYLFAELLARTSFTMALVGAALASGVVMLTIFVAVYSPLRRRGAGSSTVLLASFGLYICLSNLVSLCTQDVAATPKLSEPPLFAVSGLTDGQVLLFSAAAAMTLLGEAVLRLTRTGLALRAVAENPDLATASGISARHVAVLAALGAGALAGIAGALTALDTGVVPSSGLGLMIAGAVAVIVAGLRSPLAVAGAALAVAALQQATVIWLEPQIKDGLTYLLLFAAIYWYRHRLVGATAG